MERSSWSSVARTFGALYRVRWIDMDQFHVVQRCGTQVSSAATDKTARHSAPAKAVARREGLLMTDACCPADMTTNISGRRERTPVVLLRLEDHYVDFR